MISFDCVLFEYFDFGLNEHWDTERVKEIKKSICRLYLERIERYCSSRFDIEEKKKSGQTYFSFKFSELPLDEDNLRTEVYYYMQCPIREEVEKHLEIFKTKYPDLDSKIIITCDEIIYQNCHPLCYWILEPDIDNFISSRVNVVPHIQSIKRNTLEEIIGNITIYINEKLSEEISKEISNCKKEYLEDQQRKREIAKIKNSAKYKALSSKNDKLLWEYCFTSRSKGNINYSKLAKCIAEVKDNNVEQCFPIKQNLIEEITLEINKSELLPLNLDHKRLFKANPDYKSRKKNRS